ncbi:MAG: efflux RND transporter permease subunit [Saprospiraceae bacterium]|nr:efflux RND transporter permease subunit [Saprospiraceae bacterium]
MDTNQEIRKVALSEALIQAGKERMRPILMTTLSMAIRMLPIALATMELSEMENGMDGAIIKRVTFFSHSDGVFGSRWCIIW